MAGMAGPGPRGQQPPMAGMAGPGPRGRQQPMAGMAGPGPRGRQQPMAGTGPSKAPRRMSPSAAAGLAKRRTQAALAPTSNWERTQPGSAWAPAHQPRMVAQAAAGDQGSASARRVAPRLPANETQKKRQGRTKKTEVAARQPGQQRIAFFLARAHGQDTQGRGPRPSGGSNASGGGSLS